MTPRPGRIVTTLSITLPRPRTLDMEFSEEFKGYAKLVRDAIGPAKGPRP